MSDKILVCDQLEHHILEASRGFSVMHAGRLAAAYANQTSVMYDRQCGVLTAVCGGHRVLQPARAWGP